MLHLRMLDDYQVPHWVQRVLFLECVSFRPAFSEDQLTIRTREGILCRHVPVQLPLSYELLVTRVAFEGLCSTCGCCGLSISVTDAVCCIFRKCCLLAGEGQRTITTQVGIVGMRESVQFHI